MSDIIDRIDELVDEQMAEGEPRTGFDFGDPTYPRCPHCNRHWHGLRITQRIASMYSYGRYDPEYSVADDDTPVLCEGSQFIGPQRSSTPPAPPAVWAARFDRGERRDTNFSIRIVPDASGLTAALQAMEYRLAELMFGSSVAVAMRVWTNDSEVGSWQIPEPAQCTEPVDDVVVEFGPQNWKHEFRRIPNHMTWSYVVTPNTRAVARLWDKFTAPDYPIPVSPGIDFDAIPINAYAGTGPKPKPLGRRSP